VKRCLLVAVLFCVAVSFCFARTDPFSYPLRTVVLDAGHGGKDGGASSAWSFAGGTIQEKDFILDIAKRVADLLAVAQPQWNIVMTRADDTFIALDDRAAIAYRTVIPRKTSALFVSIHVNSATNDEAEGFEILTKIPSLRVTLLDEQTPKENISLFAPFTEMELNDLLNQRNKEVATRFETAISEHMPLSRSRGIKQQNVRVLNISRMPAVLVEVGFISNKNDATHLLAPAWRQEMANAIVAAIQACAQEES
jgi:N-acetylmuramoyl-L-alanine amidase